MEPNLPKNKKIILFDGVCNLCNNAINFIIEHDKKDVFRFASLQSDLGKQLVSERGIDPEVLDTIYLIEPRVVYYEKSTAALKIAEDLSGGYSFMKLFIYLPKFIRDGVYNLVASNRYSWFGKKESCMIPTPELKAKFLD